MVLPSCCISKFFIVVPFLLLWNVTVQENLDGCDDADLAVYKLTFETFWTRHRFPKQYPEFRPPAHWSKLMGITHDRGFTLFRVGEIASKGIKVFAETGKTDYFVVGNHTLDEFYTPSITSGAGRAQVNFFADGNHPMVSLVVKIVPSPDWFVGIDSLVLCRRRKWIDTVTVQARPMDAGTDSGFTFTAPNWATDPQERIAEITSGSPSHPANSFYYPMMETLPTIATFRLKREKVYRLTEALQSNETHRPVDTNQAQVPNPQSQNEVILDDGKHLKHKKKHRPSKKPRIHHSKCRMGEWSQWSGCNATCGAGYSHRTRTALNPVKLSKKCPILIEERKCTDYLGCHNRFFRW